MVDTLLEATERLHVLPNGVRVLIDVMPHVHSAAIGFWVDTGSRDEAPELAGACHFLEHMLFKGTPKRDALAISSALEASGGSLNAFTDKENTCFHARVLASEVPEALDVLADMLRHSLLDPKELRREKAVVIEEIKLYDDTPDDLVHELAFASFWPDHPLGRPITGTRRSVRGLTREALVGFLADTYTADRLVIGISGNVDEAAVLEQLAAAFTGFNSRGPDRQARPTRPVPGSVVRYRPVEQAHLVLTTPAIAATAPERYALALLNTILGDGMSSRLFQEVREKRGLVYHISSYESLFREGGMFAINAGMSPKHLPMVVALVHEQLDRLMAGDVTDAELDLAKRQHRGSLLLSLEVPRHRMNRMVQNQLYFGGALSPEAELAAVGAVTRADLTRLAQHLFPRAGRHVTVVGPLRKLPAGC